MPELLQGFLTALGPRRILVPEDRSTGQEVGQPLDERPFGVDLSDS